MPDSIAGRTSPAAGPRSRRRRPTRNETRALETQAWTLLRRYGVVFRRLLARETIAAPWRELARIYRRLEARGEIRGGRFVSGMSGEQFALPRAVERLREVRRTPASGALLAISTADPLNLAGIVTAGDRIRAAARNRVLYRDGVPLAVREGDSCASWRRSIRRSPRTCPARSAAAPERRSGSSARDAKRCFAWPSPGAGVGRGLAV